MQISALYALCVILNLFWVLIFQVAMHVDLVVDYAFMVKFIIKVDYLLWNSLFLGNAAMFINSAENDLNRYTAANIVANNIKLICLSCNSG